MTDHLGGRPDPEQARREIQSMMDEEKQKRDTLEYWRAEAERLLAGLEQIDCAAEISASGQVRQMIRELLSVSPLSALRSHKWIGRQIGGSPVDAGSYEWVRYCELCGVEDTGEDLIPPCQGHPSPEAPRPTPSPIDGGCGGIPQWLIYFEDAGMASEVFTDESAARARLSDLSDNWNCYLFVHDPAPCGEEAPRPR